MSKKGIIRPGRNCISLKGVDSTGVLIDARDYYRLFYRAARKAKDSILISGWEFNSGVRLLRGEDLKEAEEDIRFLNFLNDICAKNPGLRVYILAWNFSYLFILRREWMQKRIFTRVNPAISYHFDNRHAFAASQHQKFVVIDGYTAFVGGMDISSGRWDDRNHAADNPFRVDSGGRPYGPYHDVNSYHTGEVAFELAGLFRQRWLDATGREIELGQPRRADLIPKDGPGVEVAAESVAVSRTQARSLAHLKNPVKEIRTLYTDAISSARSLIYIENQYFSSYAVYRALTKRMKRSTTKLQIIFILPKKEQTFLEHAYVGIAQTRLLKSLKRRARKSGHSFGAYYPVARLGEDREEPVFVHSKLMIVDDRFMTIGSANTNNRSMGLDTELNVSWEARGKDEKKQAASIRNVRVELLSEHTGAKVGLEEADGLVDRIDAIADSPAGKLRKYRITKSIYLSRLFRYLKLDRVVMDPERAVIDENILAVVSSERGSFLRRGARYLKRLLKR